MEGHITYDSGGGYPGLFGGRFRARRPAHVLARYTQLPPPLHPASSTTPPTQARPLPPTQARPLLPDHRPLLPDHHPLLPDHRPLLPDHRPLLPDHRPLPPDHRPLLPDPTSLRRP